jgi:coenzyme Q-binding protein COQ10
MVTHTMQELVVYSPAQLYALVLDIEQYPEFIPWCRSARILSRDEKSFLGELVIAFKHIRESYVSRVTGDEQAMRIHVEMERGPFHHLINTWYFEAHEQGCMIHFHIDFAFKSKLLDAIIGSLFSRATKKMVGAFKSRADAIYGSVSGNTA